MPPANGLVAEAGVDASGGGDEGVVGWHQSLFVGGGLDVDISEDAALHDDEAVFLAEFEEFHRVVPELGCEDAIAGDGGAAALGVAEDDIA